MMSLEKVKDSILLIRSKKLLKLVVAIRFHFITCDWRGLRHIPVFAPAAPALSQGFGGDTAAIFK